MTQTDRDRDAQRDDACTVAPPSDTEEAEEAIQRRNRHLAALNAIAMAASESLDLDTVLKVALETTLDVLGVEFGGIYLLEPDGETLTLRVHRAPSARFARAVSRLRFGEGITGQAVSQKRPVVLHVPDYPPGRLAPFIREENLETLASTPLIARGRVVGALTLATRQARGFPLDELDILAAIGRQLGAAVDNARLYQRERRLLAHLRRLNQATARAGVTLNLEALARVVTETLVEEFDAAFARLWVVDESGETLVLRGSAGLYTRLDGERARVPIATDPYKLGVIARERRPLVTNNVREDPQFDQAWAEREGLVAFAGYPIVQEERLVGVLALFTRYPLEPEILDVLGAFVNQVAVAIENARLYEEARRRLAQEERVSTLAATLAGALDLSDLIPRLLPAIAEITGADASTVAILDPYRQVITYPYHYNLPDELAGVEVPAGTGMAWATMEARQPMLLDDYREHPAALQAWVEAGVRSVLAVPLIVGDDVVGAIGLFTLHQVRPFDQEAITAAQTAASLAAIAVQRARLFESERKRASHMALVAEVARRSLSILEPDALLQEAAEAIQSAFGYADVLIFLVDHERHGMVRKAWAGWYPRDQGIDPFKPIEDQGVMDWVATHGETAVVNDVHSDPRYVPFFEQTASELCVPLQDGDTILGGINVESDRPYAFTESDVLAMETLADHLVVALRNARLFAETRRRAEQMALVHTIGQQITPLLDVDDLLQRAAEALHTRFGYLSVQIYLLDRETGELEARGVAGEEGIVVRGYRQKVGEGITGRAAALGERVLIGDVTQDPDFIPCVPGSRSELALPIWVGDEVAGVLNIESDQLNGFDECDVIALEALARQLGVALENARLFEAERRRAEETAALLATGRVLSSLELDEVLETIVRQARTLFQADGSRIHLLEPDGETLRCVVALHDRAEAVKAMTVKVGQGMTGRVARTGEPELIPNTLADPDAIQVPGTPVEPEAMALAPLKVRDRVIGVMTVSRLGTDRPFTSADLSLVAAFASQAAAAIENARLFHAESRRRREAETLREAIAAVSSALDLDQVLENILTYIGQVIPYDSACVYLLEGDRLRAVAGKGFPEPEKVIGHEYPAQQDALFQEMQRTLRPLCIADVQADPRFRAWGDVDYIRGWIGVPLVVRGEAIGCLTLDSRQAGAYDEAHAVLAQAFANQAAIAIENARLYTSAVEAARRRTILHQASQDIVRAGLDPERVFVAIHRATARIMPVEAFVIAWLDASREEIVGVYLVDRGGRQPPMRIPAHRGLSGHVIATGEPLLINDLEAFTGDLDIVHFGTPEHVRSILAVPMRLGGRVLGVLSAQSYRPNAYTDDDQQLLEMLAAHAAGALENVRLFTETRHRAAHMEALSTIIAAAATAEDMRDLLETALDNMLHPLGLSIGAIWVGGRYTLRGIPEEVVPELSGIARGMGLDIPAPAVVADWQQVPEDATHAALVAVMTRVGIRASLTVPILARGRRIGGCSVACSEPRHWSQEEIALTEAVGRQLGTVAERLHLLEEVQEQARLMQQIMDTVPEGIVLLDPQRRIVLANPTAQQYLPLLTDARPGDVLTQLGGHPVERLLAPPPVGLWHEIVVEGPPRRVFEAVAQPVPPGMDTAGCVLVLSDVTRDREVQERAQEQERLAAVGQLAAGIAHDFNNILQGVIGFADLLADRPDTPEPVRERLRMIAEQGRRGARLIRQILDFSRKSIVERHPLDLVPLLKEIVKMLEHTLPENIRLVLDIVPGTYMLNSDPTQLQQIITNLATNARDAMPEGGVLLISLSGLTLHPGDPPPLPHMSPGEWIVLRVADTGTGIPAEHLPHIFEPFFTTKAPGEGTGLGLAQVYGIVRQHEGHIDVSSQVGQGTTFTVYLPALQIPGETVSPATQPAVPRGRGQTILLVEDAPHVLAIVEAMLHDLGYRVITAREGEEALRLYEQYRQEIALVLTDMVMPGMSGMLLARALRERDADVPVVVMSGYPLVEERADITPDGVTAWLHKPFSATTLAKMLHSLLEAERPEVSEPEVSGSEGEAQ